MNIDNGSDAPLISDSLQNEAVSDKKESADATQQKLEMLKVQAHKIMEEP